VFGGWQDSNDAAEICRIPLLVYSYLTDSTDFWFQFNVFVVAQAINASLRNHPF
jgi:hypothetical protein